MLVIESVLAEIRQLPSNLTDRLNLAWEGKGAVVLDSIHKKLPPDAVLEIESCIRSLLNEGIRNAEEVGRILRTANHASERELREEHHDLLNELDNAVDAIQLDLISLLDSATSIRAGSLLEHDCMLIDTLTDAIKHNSLGR